MKKFLLGVLVGVAITAAGSAYADEGLEKIEAYLRPSLPVTMDGNQLKLESPPVMVDGSTYLKLRDVAAVTGVGVNWNESTQTVELTSKGVVKVSETTQQEVTSNQEKINELKKKIEDEKNYIQKEKDIFEVNKNLSTIPGYSQDNYKKAVDLYNSNVAQAESRIADYESQIAALQAQQ